MTTPFDSRRKMIKAALAIPLLTGAGVAGAAQICRLKLPVDTKGNIPQALEKLYGSKVNNISTSHYLSLNAPPIAENGMEVGIKVLGKKGLFQSIAVFSEKNPNPFIARIRLNSVTDLPMRLRIRIPRTTDVHVYAETPNGLIVAKREIKVTIGCGGG